MDDLSSVSSKKRNDSRNNWVTMVFVCKNRYNCFGKKSHINTCIEAFKEFKANGFEFDEIGFGGTHVHLLVNVPKQYSITNAETMLKSRSAKRIFEQHPGFKKRYPRGSFWSGYEHHQSTGMQNITESAKYIHEQTEHHNVKVIDDTQTRINAY